MIPALIERLTPDRRVWVLVTIAAVPGALFGGDTGGIGAITEMTHFKNDIGHLSPIVRGITVSIIIATSSISGIFGGTLSDKLSRKWALSLGCGIFGVGAALCAAATGLPMLLACRGFAGIGEGIFLSVGTTYVVEVSPKHMRGQTILYYQLIICIGVASGFFIAYGATQLDSTLSWRLPFILSAFVAFLMMVLTPLLPYSPRWLLMQNRRQEAEAVLQLVIGPAQERHAERVEMLSAGSVPKGVSPWEMFEKEVRGRTLLGVFLQVIQMLSGIDFILYYAPLLFAQAGLDPSTTSLVASGVTGLVLAVTTAAASLWIDKIGRRPLLLVGGLVTALAECYMGIVYASDAHKSAIGRWSVVAAIEIYTIAFSGTWAIVTRLYASEIQPNRTRSSAVSLGTGCNQLVNTLVALTAPLFLDRSSYGPYFLYSGCMLFGVIVCYFVLPETLGKSLETIESTFTSEPSPAAKWTSILKRQGRRDSIAAVELRNRRPSRTTALAAEGDGENPAASRAEFRRAHLGMERLNSDAFIS